MGSWGHAIETEAEPAVWDLLRMQHVVAHFIGEDLSDYFGHSHKINETWEHLAF
jgi:hypothetical protein